MPLAGLLAYRRGRPVRAAGLLAYGVLTRETALVAVAAIAAVRLVALVRRHTRPGLTDLTWSAPVAIFAISQVVVRSAIGRFPITQDAQDNSGGPLSPLLHAISTDVRQALSLHIDNVIWVIELAVLLVVIVDAITALRSTAAPLHERLAFGAYIVELGLLSPGIWNGVADLRSLNDVYVLAVVILISSRRRTSWGLAAILAPTLAIVMAHRVVSL